ncbi:ribosome small subunit-dependent GTPase A [Persephonella sp.]
MRKGLVVDREAQMIGVYLFEEKKIYRGIPRKKVLKKTRIYAGDYVIGSLVDKETFAIEKVEERKNFLVRPPVANVDKVIIVFTLKKPDFDSFLLDNLLVVYEYLGAEPVIVFNKIDLLNEDERKELKKWKDIYSNAGYDFIPVSAVSKEGIDELKDYLRDNISVFAGPSGVGKSSILSVLIGVELKVGQISEKTDRGRHTTTGVRLYQFNERSFIGDTPGFSSVDALQFMDRRELKNYFREFLRYRCRFSDCTHTDEPGCLVKEAVEKGEISKERYRNYIRMIDSSK